jgi:hypothetical protein
MAWLSPLRGDVVFTLFPVVSLRSTTGYGALKPSASTKVIENPN